MKRNRQLNQKKNNKVTASTRNENSFDPLRIRQVWAVRNKCPCQGKAGFGLNEVIGIAAGIIIAVVVVIPGLQGFAGDILENLRNWWNNMASSVFSTP